MLRQPSYLISTVSDSLSVSWLFHNKRLILVNRRPLCNVVDSGDLKPTAKEHLQQEQLKTPNILKTPS